MTGPAADTGTGTAPHREGRRGWRIVIPFAVLGLLVSATLLARHMEEPDLTEPTTLSPAGTGPDGSSRLAAMLSDLGVRVERVDDLERALAAVERGPAGVVFVPKPTLAGAGLAGAAVRAGRGHRVILVAPNDLHLLVAGLPVVSGPTRWAARAVEPDCPVPEALAAGPAAAQRRRYAMAGVPGDSCYGGGLVRTRLDGSEVYLVGAADPFRNRRIGERGTAPLAVGLLSGYDRVIWVGALPRPPGSLPELRVPGRGELDRSAGNAFQELVDGYPPGVLAGFALAALLAVLVAVARARRLGPPVPEPLPVRVPAAESVAGRGRLYQRTNGRGVALAALRHGASVRLARALGLPPAPPPDPEDLVAAVVDRTGLPEHQVRQILHGPEPPTDQDLVDAAAALDALVAATVQDLPTDPARKEPS